MDVHLSAKNVSAALDFSFNKKYYMLHYSMSIGLALELTDG